MPIFVYRCPDGHTTERLQPKPARWIPCPGSKCGRVAVRTPTGAAVHFKGSGFYQTDYKGDE